MGENGKKRVASLTPEQRRQILQRLQKKQTKASQIPLLPRGQGTNIFPLSYAQQRLWFQDQLQPGNPAYVIPSILRIHGEIDIHALERSIRTLIHRHESLRTTFSERDGEPVQVIHPVGNYLLPVIDLSHLEVARRDKEAQRLAQQAAQCAYDLVRGPLLRTLLLHLKRDEHMFLVTLHHIITDEWSGTIFVRELATLYQAYQVGGPSPLAPVPIQYADYALWQRQWLQGEVLATQVDYWRKQLAGISFLKLPSDHPRPDMQTYRGAVRTTFLPVDVLTQLQTLSQQEGVTLFMLLLTAFQVLLLRYTGQQDISVGTSIANRMRADVEGVIGYFANVLVMRCDLSGDPTFLQLLKQVSKVCLQAYAHQDIPFTKIVEELEPERDLSRSPFFQVMFDLQSMSQERGNRASASVEFVSVGRTSSKFDLTLALTETRQGLYGKLEYNTDLFEEGTIIRLLNHWENVLHGVVQTPRAHLSELPLLSIQEREQLLVTWNATQAAYPEHLCLHDLFTRQVARTPDAIAVESGAKQLTYAQLDRLTNQVAHYLQHLGVGPDVLVGLALPRSIELIIGMLGILKAGGAYVPLDMASPELRLAAIVESAHLSILLTLSPLRARLPTVEQMICLDSAWRVMMRSPQEEPARTVQPTNLAYVIYTSGSTGQPKGVMIPHQGVVHYVDWSSKHYAVADGMGSAMHSPLSFDLTITSLFPALAVGRRVILTPEEPGIEALSALLAQKPDLSVLKLTPAHLNLLTQTLPLERFPTAARALIIGGEALHADSVQVWRQHAAATRLINEYGPTETVVGCCIYEIAAGEELADAVPIGRPLPNTQIYLLDAHMQLVPIGVPGELYIGGIGLGRGYLHRPDLTAERFVANPFSREPGARLYKTGDLARYRAEDGILEYLGRIDTQVKLRGYRIELAEIEAVLRQHPQVADSVVRLQETGPAAPRLIGYVVARTQLSSEELDEIARKYLPDYMIPAQFIIIDALPLTANGKVDHRRLPRPELVPRSEASMQNESPGPIEEILLKLWQKLLAAPQIGIYDSFFKAGGHSLLAVRLIAQIRVLFQVELSVPAFFDAPTVAEVAKHVKQALDHNRGLARPPLVAMARPEAIPLSFAQQRLWFLDRLQPGNHAYLVSMTEHLGFVSIRALERSLEELVRRHESLRTTFTSYAGQPVQRIHPPDRPRLPLIDLCGLRAERKKTEAWRLSTLEAQRPCDLERGPLLRIHLIRLEREEHILQLTLHHIITDGWSNEILVDELITLYGAYVSGRPSPLAPLPLQYADYALWQRQWLQGEALEAQLDYWTRQLGGVRPIKLPTDYAYPLVPTSRGAIHHFTLTEDLSRALLALSHQENVTLFMTLLAAFQVLFYRYTEQTDIVIGTDSANRNHVETEDMVGFFVNLLALRVDLSGKPSFKEVLKRVRAVVLAAYTHGETPFELLVEKLAPDHYLVHMPLVQVLFVMQNLPVKAQKITDVVVQAKPEAAGQAQSQPATDRETAAKFDLALFMQEHSGKLMGALNYRLDLFRENTIALFVSRFIALLQSSVSQPDESIDLLDIRSEAENEQQKQEEQKRRKELQISHDAWLDFSAMNFTGQENNL
ncbi:MAG TPA: amino acid adenylation domain-containing protein [Ktedonobacteraceae bacterium]|nr:amino acid adenylation domain-containing protein [Ktedonobacteraceae bacterium]